MSKNEELSGFTEIKLNVEEEFLEIIGETKDFPKYTTQIINLANQNAQGTRPQVVGQMSELIHECPIKTFKGWKEWYQKHHPDAIEKATIRVTGMIDNLREAIDKIDDDMIKEWVEDLVITKTAEGLVIQEIILKDLAEKLNKDMRRANPEEESMNIDGYIGKTPVQIKPISFLSKKSTVRDSISVETVYYKKTNTYLYIYTNLL